MPLAVLGSYCCLSVPSRVSVNMVVRACLLPSARAHRPSQIFTHQGMAATQHSIGNSLSPCCACRQQCR